jgi:hypothetical protein
VVNGAAGVLQALVTRLGRTTNNWPHQFAIQLITRCSEIAHSEGRFLVNDPKSDMAMAVSPK